MSGFFDRVGTDVKHGGGEAMGVPPSAPSAHLGLQGPAQFRAGFKRFGSIDSTVFYGVAETHDALPAGVYRCEMREMMGPVLVKQTIETDKLMELPDDAGKSILAEFKAFWEIEEKFRERGFLHKRGFMLWGPPGSGKTSTLQLMMKRMVDEQKGVVLFIDHPGAASSCLALARGIEPRRPVVAVLEDLDALVYRYGENEFLALLDGEAQVDSIIFVATTNYPERLDRRFVDRPSRFDTIREIGMPSAAARRVYLQTKEPSLGGDELETWVLASEGFSIAHLKEMIIAVRCFGQPLEAVVERLEEMRVRRPSSEQGSDRPAFGFGRHIGGAARLGNGAAYRT